jgi:hypothetical protein
MTAESTFRLDFGRPVAGWLPVRLDGAGVTWEAVASAVPRDTVADVARAALLLLDDWAEPVVWNGEPMQTEWRFAVAGDRVRLEIAELPAGPCLRVEGPTLDLVRAIRRALRRLKASAEGWPHPFPEGTVLRLGQRLAG